MSLTKVKASNITLTTAAANSNDTTPATTQYVTTAINNLIDGAPATLNTLDEIAAALNDDAALNTTLTNAIAAKLPLDGSSAMTGNLDINGNQLILDADADTSIRESADDYLIMKIGGTDLIKIDSSGLGIGIRPAEMLDIQSASGDARIRLDAPSGSDTEVKFFNAGSAQYTIGHDDATDNFVIGGANVDTAFVSVDKSGNVGIGTDSPDAKLEITGSSNSTYLIAGGDDASNGRGLTFTSSASTNFNGAVHTIRAPSSQGEIAFKTNTTEAMRIDSSAYVGIGTVNPLSKFTVQGSSASTYTGNGPTPTIRASQSTDGNWIASDVDGKFAYFGVDGNDGKFAAYNYASSTEMGMILGQNRVRIDNTGRVGINRTPAITNSKLEVGGADNTPLINVEASGATAGVGIGSSRMKFYYGTAEKASLDSNGNLRTARQIIQENSSGTPRFINIPYTSAGSGFTFDFMDLANHSAVGDQAAETNAFMFEVNVTSYLFRRVKALIIVDTNANNSIAVETLHSSTLTCSASIPTNSTNITITISGLWGNAVNYMGRITTF